MRAIYFYLILGFSVIVFSCCDNTIEAPPTAVPEFTYSISGDTVYFQLLSSGYESIEWDFGDGKTSTKRNPKHVYTKSRTFNVYLRVRVKKQGVSNEYLYNSKAPIVDRNQYEELFAFKPIQFNYTGPVYAKLYKSGNVGYSAMQIEIDFGDPRNGSFEHYFEFAYDSFFTKPAYGFLKGDNINHHLTGVGQINRNSGSFIISKLTPGTQYYYRLRQEFVSNSNSSDKRTHYTRIRRVQLNEMPDVVFEFYDDFSPPTVANYRFEFTPPNVLDELIVSTDVSFSTDFSEVITPMRYDISGRFNNYIHLGETLYMRVKYTLKDDPENYFGEAVQTHTSSDKYLAFPVRESEDIFRGNDVRFQKSGVNYLITIGTNNTEKVIINLKDPIIGANNYLKGGSENSTDNYAVYYDADGNKYLTKTNSKTFVNFQEFSENNFKLCLLKDLFLGEGVEFENPNTLEIKAFKAFIFRIED